MDASNSDIHIDTFKTLPLNMQRLYADQYNVPEGCATEEICRIIFQGRKGGDAFIPAIEGHVLYPLPMANGYRPFKSVIDCADWLLKKRMIELIEPKNWIYELPSSAEEPPEHNATLPTETTDEDRDTLLTSELSSGRPIEPLKLDQSGESEDIDCAGAPPESVQSNESALSYGVLYQTVEKLRDNLKKAQAQIKKTHLLGREAAADLWELDTEMKKNRLYCEDAFHSVAKFVKGRLARRIRRELRFAVKFSRLPSEDGDEYYYSDSSDYTVSSDDSRTDPSGKDDDDDDDSDEDDDGGDGEQQSYIPDSIPERSPTRATNTSPTVEQRLLELQWSVARPSTPPMLKRNREDEDHIPEQYERTELKERRAQPSPTKRRRLEDDSKSSSSGSETSNIRWNDLSSINSDDSTDSSYSGRGYLSSDKSSGPEDYILNSDDEVELQIDCETFLNHSSGDSDAGSKFDDADSASYDSEDSGITWITIASSSENAADTDNFNSYLDSHNLIPHYDLPGPSVRRTNALVRSDETLHQDEFGQLFADNWRERNEHIDLLDEMTQIPGWLDMADEDLLERMDQISRSESNQYEFDDQAFQQFEPDPKTME